MGKHDITIDVRHVVTISGARSNHREIDRILSVALLVNGARDIRNDMNIEHETYRVRLKPEDIN